MTSCDSYEVCLLCAAIFTARGAHAANQSQVPVVGQIRVPHLIQTVVRLAPRVAKSNWRILSFRVLHNVASFSLLIASCFMRKTSLSKQPQVAALPDGLGLPSLPHAHEHREAGSQSLADLDVQQSGRLQGCQAARWHCQWMSSQVHVLIPVGGAQDKQQIQQAAVVRTVKPKPSREVPDAERVLSLRTRLMI